MLDCNNVFDAAEQVLNSDTVESKIKASLDAVILWQNGKLSLQASTETECLVRFKNPARPFLVEPSKLPNRSVATSHGQAAFIHAITHIEFSAINLAWDAIYRYRDLPHSYYEDWIKVASEETNHFLMLNQRLDELSYTYGDFDAHSGLWDMAEKTAHSFLHRMAVIPRGLEARGLDVTPKLIKRLRSVGDNRTVGLLQLILDDEIGHVAIGDRWFRYACQKQNCEPEQTYQKIVIQYTNSHIRGPFNIEARVKAGFSIEELKQLEKC